MDVLSIAYREHQLHISPRMGGCSVECYLCQGSSSQINLSNAVGAISINANLRDIKFPNHSHDYQGEIFVEYASCLLQVIEPQHRSVRTLHRRTCVHSIDEHHLGDFFFIVLLEGSFSRGSPSLMVAVYRCFSFLSLCSRHWSLMVAIYR